MSRERSPRAVFAEDYGERPTRGIRGGRAARRKREAYLKYQESLGYSRSEIPIAHTGGQQRPLLTPLTWSPESSEDLKHLTWVNGRR